MFITKLTKKEKLKIAKRELNRADKKWKAAVKERDGFKCVICGEEKMLNAHHIIPREIKELRHDVQNGISLCPKHHKFSNEISAHKNPFAFMVWLCDNRPKQTAYLSLKINPSSRLSWNYNYQKVKSESFTYAKMPSTHYSHANL